MNRAVFALLVAGCTVGETLPSSEPPPTWGKPISGGNLLVTRDGTRAVIADLDRDRILVVTLDTNKIDELALGADSEPGRLVEDGGGRVHIALRGSGELFTLGTGERRRVCAEPRGLAWDAARDLIHVACASGELVSVPAGGGEPVRSLKLERDLRDVIVQGDQLVVTRLKTAEVLVVDAQGAIASRTVPATVRRVEPVFDGSGSGANEIAEAIPTVAWRTVALPDGRLVVAHQRKRSRELRSSFGGYSVQCGQGQVESAVSVITPGQAPIATAPLVRGALPVDVAVAADGSQLAFVAAGARTVHVVLATALETHDDEECGDGGDVDTRVFDDDLGAPTSVAFRGSTEILVYYPELPALVIRDLASADKARSIRLPGELGYDSGRALFHRQTSAGLACASCHPEGREDGQVWDFAMLGERRTQSLGGGILGRAPYHWGGDMADLPTLMRAVFAERMAGFGITRSETLSLGPWLDRLSAPQPSTIVDADAVARGQALFLSAETRCVQCHVGPAYTNNRLVDIGTGGLVKVPSLLGVGARAPFMHTGCAPTLRDRFGPCGGGDIHGQTSFLSDAQVADLAAFLDAI